MRSRITVFRGEHFFLSNFSPVGDTTLEHQYQAAKTLDPEWRARILSAETPAKAKKLGRQAPVRIDWESIKLSWMLQLLRWKFSVEPLRAQLVGTGDAELVEEVWWHDNFWGCCTCPRCSGLPKENHLGRLLMQVRQELQLQISRGERA